MNDPQLLKEVEVRVVKIKGDESKRLRHQLVVDIQDEDIPTEERYDAIVKLYQLEYPNEFKECIAVGPSARTTRDFKFNDFCKDLGISTKI